MSQYRCEHCPLKKLNMDQIPCVAYARPHPRFCELSEESSKYDKVIIDKSIEIYGSAKELPGWGGTASNFAEAMLRWGKAGFSLVPEKELTERLNICYDCPLYDEDSNRCKECGCFVDKKARLSSESCPIDKWTVYTIKKPAENGGCGCRRKTDDQ